MQIKAKKKLLAWQVSARYSHSFFCYCFSWNKAYMRAIKIELIQLSKLIFCTCFINK
jgi:hypothetical protein